MLSENKNKIESQTPRLWNKATDLLFQPNSNIIEVGDRRHARLTSIIALIFGFLNLVGAVSIFFVNGLTRNVFVLIGLAIVSSTGYGFSRTRHYKIGSYLITWALVAVAFGAGDASRLSASLSTNLILAFILASITFPLRYMTFFVIINNIAIGLLPIFYPGYTEVGTTLGVFIPFSVLTLVAIHHRTNVERDRISETQQLNRELTTLTSELEQRVNDRTSKLEERAGHLQAITEIARATASLQDLEQLLSDSTRLISESFDFYHVGIFLLDEANENAILRAANSEGGQRMLGRQHSLPVDLNSIVGSTVKTQNPRIALDTGIDAAHFDNPDLPETRSEMAVPLKIGPRLIGVLDVQSKQKEAFSEDDIAILGTLGDQLAVALENTRLLDEARQALATSEETYQRYFNQVWSQFSKHREREGYLYHAGKVHPLDKQSNNNGGKNINSILRIPLRVRGQEIGSLEVEQKSNKQSWSAEEMSLLEATAERAALALESARLLENAQRRASREQAIGEIANSLNRASLVETILQATVEELGSRLTDTKGVTIEMINSIDK